MNKISPVCRIKRVYGGILVSLQLVEKDKVIAQYIQKVKIICFIYPLYNLTKKKRLNFISLKV